MMSGVVKIFTYQTRRSAYLTIVATTSFILLIEGGSISLLFILLVSSLLAKMLLLIGVGGLYLYIFVFLLAPLWTKHRLDASHVHIHYGLNFNTKLPRELIREALPVQKQLTLFERLSAQYDIKQKRIMASFSDQGQVLLRLHQTTLLKLGYATKHVDELLINVDQREEFLAALAVSIPDPRTSDQTPILEQKKELRGTTDNQQADMPVMSIPLLGQSDSFYQPATSTAVIHTDKLTYAFGSFVAVDTLSIDVYPGEIYGFLGSNGAGKTTTIKMLVGLLQPSHGYVYIAGHDIWKDSVVSKRSLGYVADHSIIYERLTGREFLTFLGQLRCLSHDEVEKRTIQLFDLLELTEHADRLCGSYSFGMKRKLALAGALLPQPQVLILDEPLNGLDPHSARRLKDLFLELSSRGIAILLSTHDLTVAEAVCHRVGIIHHGRLLIEGKPSDLSQLAKASDLEAAFLSLTTEQTQEIGL